MNPKTETTKLATIAYCLIFAALLGLTIFLCFYRLDAKYVDPWDEARHGVNAYEMLHGGSLIQNTYLRQADYYNLKPPMSMWSIMLAMKLFGSTVFALRFPAAICYMLLVLAVGLFARRYGRLESLFAMAFLALNTTPFQAHMIRSGDADSLYVLLFTLAMLAMMKVGENVRFVYVCGLLFALAFLTKSFHAGIIMAIGGLYLILTGDIKKMKLKHWCGFLAAALLPILLWALLRLRMDGTTFFRAMWETDVLGRTDGTLQNNIAPFSYYASYYFGAMSGKTTVYLCALVICLLGAICFSKKLAWGNRREYLGYLLWFGVTFLAFSAVKNKLLWYMYPALIALLMGAGLLLAKLLQDRELLPAVKLMLAACACVMFCCFVKSEIGTMREQGANAFQELICEAAELSGLRDCNVYVDYDAGNPNWSQQDVFVAETAGDYRCVNGGVMALYVSSTVEGKKGLLFAGKEMCEAAAPFYEDLELLAETDEYCVYVVTY